MVYKSTVDYWTVQNMFKIYVLLGDIWRTREALGQKFSHEPLLNMLVAVNAEAPACYAIPGIPALPTSTSGFFGCGTENSAPLSEFKIPDDPIFHVCCLHQQWKRLHVTPAAVLSAPGIFVLLLWVLLGWYHNANNGTQPRPEEHMLLSVLSVFFSFYQLTHRQLWHQSGFFRSNVQHHNSRSQ